MVYTLLTCTGFLKALLKTAVALRHARLKQPGLKFKEKGTLNLKVGTGVRILRGTSYLFRAKGNAAAIRSMSLRL